MKSDTLVPKQQRSRETLARLLNAAIVTLEEHGLDGTTIPRVAAAAGVAPASVYRRFSDKNALFRAAFLMVLEQSVATNRTALRTKSTGARTLSAAVSQIVTALSRQYRDHPGLLRALVRFLETDEDSSFREKAVGYLASNFDIAGKGLLTLRKGIAHKTPERAVLFGLLAVATILEVRAFESFSMWHAILPMSDREVELELSRLLLAYLRHR
jgi:AcrR family transcriptional regulator